MDDSTKPSDASDTSTESPPSQSVENHDIQATLSDDGFFVQYNICGVVVEVTAKYTPPILPLGRGAYGIVLYVIYFISI